MCIVDIVISGGESGVSFKDIVSQSGLRPTTAAYHLKILCRTGITEKMFRNHEGRRDYSFYHLTTIGDRAYHSAMDMQRGLGESRAFRYPMEPWNIEIVSIRNGPRCISFERTEG
ncbi:MAG: hypothetical protein JXA22_10345 [Candidatus Thermoplasmatota archaeon]|nr:hypothetical protein [Candidatus Thermoplasmatota archaeon]